jgi:hypothetical protein
MPIVQPVLSNRYHLAAKYLAANQDRQIILSFRRVVPALNAIVVA